MFPFQHSDPDVSKNVNGNAEELKDQHLPVHFDGSIFQLFNCYLVDAQVIVERLSTGQRDIDKL